MIKYNVIDRHTKMVVGKPYRTMHRARSAADRKDLQYGAYRYGVQPVEVTE